MENKEKMVSFSELDENGNLREAYGRFRKYDDGKSFYERMQEMNEMRNSMEKNSDDNVNKTNNVEKENIIRK